MYMFTNNQKYMHWCATETLLWTQFKKKVSDCSGNKRKGLLVNYEYTYMCTYEYIYVYSYIYMYTYTYVI